MEIKTYGPDEKCPKSVILPQQTHSNNIVEIITGNENLSDCDGIFTKFTPFSATKRSFKLGIKTADCAPIVFWNDEKYGIIHAGWRGLCNGIIEKMMKNFEDGNSDPGVESLLLKNKPRGQILDQSLNIWIGPILPKFEIQKDFCYNIICEKFGDQFFTPISPRIETHFISKRDKTKRYLFDFKSALKSILPIAKFDGRSTYGEKNLASWRRDANKKRNLTVVNP